MDFPGHIKSSRERLSLERPRTPLSARLQALFTDSSPNASGSSIPSTSNDQSPRSSTDSQQGIFGDNMWHSTARRSASALNTLSNTLDSPRFRAPKRKSPNGSTSELPVLRWFGKAQDLVLSPASQVDPSSSTSSPSSPPSALEEALEDDIVLTHSPWLSPEFDGMHPRRPAPAQLPVSNVHAGRIPMLRSPPFLDSLARSTLPTASITHPPPVFRQPSGHSIQHSETETFIDVTQSPPPHTSLDTLRLLRDRGISVVPGPFGPNGAHGRSFSTGITLGPTKWFWNKDRKDDVDQLLEETDQRDTVEGEQAHIRQKYLAPRNPVVFCHGLLGFDNVKIGPAIAPVSVAHWRGIKEVLEARGIEVLVTRVPATSSPMERAKVLEERVSAVYPGRSVHLIGHSMGGLDCRYLTTHLQQRKFKVLSITTVATPHRGSSFADHFIATVGKERIPSFVSLLELLPNGGGDGKAFESLTLNAMRKFNEETPDVDGVQYFSWGAVFEPGILDVFKWSHSVILEKEGPNDGLVSVASAKWGTYLGTLEDVNHLDLIGWLNTARYKWAEFTGREIKFKPATFYLGVADHLARHVEGQGPDTCLVSQAKTAETSRAGEGVKTVESIENVGPTSSEEANNSRPSDLDGLRRRTPTPDSISKRSAS